MAEIDSSIYSQLRGVNVGASIEQGMKLADLGQQRKAKQLEAEKQQKIQAAYSSSQNADGSFDNKKLLSGIGQVDGEKALGMGRDFANDGDKDLVRKMKIVDVQGQVLGAAVDDGTWVAGKQKLQSMGVDVSDVPDYFDPKFKQMAMEQTQSASEQMAKQWKESESKRAQGNSDREFGMQQNQFDRSGQQFQQTFGLQKDQFGYNKKQGDRNFGLETQKFDYSKDKDVREFDLKEKEIGVKALERKDKNKEMTVTQAKQNGLYKQGVEAEKQYKAAISKTGFDSYDPTSSFQWIDKNDWAPNLLKSGEAIEAQRSQDRWVEAFLRDASGAAIPPSERGAYIKDFFPVAGDSKQETLNKEKARQLKMETAKLASGISEGDAPPSRKELYSMDDGSIDALYNQLQGK